MRLRDYETSNALTLPMESRVLVGNKRWCQSENGTSLTNSSARPMSETSPEAAAEGQVYGLTLDRASGGGRRVEVAIVYKLIEFGTIPGNAQTF